MNNKGFTTVEVLVCFVIVLVVMMSLFSTISSFNEKKIQESTRARVYEYKNTITNVVQHDIIKRGLTYAKIKESPTSPGEKEGKKFTVDLTFRDGVQKQLVVFQRFTRTAYRIEGAEENDSFYIEYGVPEGNTAGLKPDMVRYELPNLGESYGYYDTSSNTYVTTYMKNGRCYDNPKGEGYELTSCWTAKDFQINNIAISITNESDPTAESHVLNVYVGFYHPNLGTKYAFNIVAPIDYQSSSVDSASGFVTDQYNPNSTTKIYYP